MSFSANIAVVLVAAIVIAFLYYMPFEILHFPITL